jgi:type IV pilus assembly protein PilX
MGCQRGAALFMALIFLLIMTILGVAGMNLSRMENLMSGNNQFQTAALVNAELMMSSAIRDLEANLGAPFLNLNTEGDHFYLRNEDSTENIEPTDLNWTFTTASSTPAGGSGDYGYRYVVEYIGQLEGSDDGDCSVVIKPKPVDCYRQIYTVTSQSDTSRGAKRTVQVVYVTEESL